MSSGGRHEEEFDCALTSCLHRHHRSFFWSGPADHRHARLSERHDDNRRCAVARPAAKISAVRSSAKRQESKPFWPARIVPPEGAAKRPADHHRRCRLWRIKHIRRRHSNSSARPHRAGRLALHEFQLDRFCSPTRAALITGRNHHSVGFGVIAEQATGYPGYDSVITKDKATIGSILTDNGYHTRGSARTTTHRNIRPVRPVPSTSGRPAWASNISTASWVATPTSGSRETSSAIRRRFIRINGKPGWNLMTAMADEAIEYMNRINALSPDAPFLIKFAPGGHACAASPDPGMGQEDQRHAPVRPGLEQAARDDLRKPEEARRHSCEREADALAKDLLKDGTSSRRTRRNCSSARSISLPPTWPTQTTRSAALSRRSKT